MSKRVEPLSREGEALLVSIRKLIELISNHQDAMNALLDVVDLVIPFVKLILVVEQLVSILVLKRVLLVVLCFVRPGRKRQVVVIKILVVYFISHFSGACWDRELSISIINPVVGAIGAYLLEGLVFQIVPRSDETRLSPPGSITSGQKLLDFVLDFLAQFWLELDFV